MLFQVVLDQVSFIACLLAVNQAKFRQGVFRLLTGVWVHMSLFDFVLTSSVAPVDTALITNSKVDNRAIDQTGQS